MANKKKSNNFLVHGSILAFASIICRVIGILYRIPLQNILGDKGMGYYSAAFQVYSILLLLSSYSMPLAVSKLVSASVAKKEYKNGMRIFWDAAIFSLGMGLLAGGITFLGADKFASFTKYTHSSIALRMLAPTLVIMSVVGVLRGFFQGMGTMIPTAVSNLVEQIANAIVSIVAAYFLFAYGKTLDEASGSSYKGVAWGAAGGTMGTGIGALSALLFLIFTFVLFRIVYKRRMAKDRHKNVLSHKEIASLIAVTVVPVILSTTIYNLSEVLDSTVFGNIMSSKHIDEDTYSALYGMFSGKYRLLTNVPVSIAASLASAIIPSMIASYAIGEIKEVTKKIEAALRFTMLLAIPSAVGLFVLSGPILSLMFSGNIFIPTIMMRIGAASIIFYSISTITNAVLQGIDRMRVPIIHSSIALGVHLIVLAILLKFTHFGVFAVVMTDVLFPLIVCVLNAISIKKYVGFKAEYVKTYIKPLASAGVMGVVAWLVYYGCLKLIHSNAISVVVAILFAMLVYGMMMLLIHGVEEEDLRRLPKGASMVNLLKKTKLL